MVLERFPGDQLITGIIFDEQDVNWVGRHQRTFQQDGERKRARVSTRCNGNRPADQVMPLVLVLNIDSFYRTLSHTGGPQSPSGWTNYGGDGA